MKTIYAREVLEDEMSSLTDLIRDGHILPHHEDQYVKRREELKFAIKLLEDWNG